MTWRKVLHGLLALLALLALLVAYLFLYLFPTLAQVNRLRREASDGERQIALNVEAEAEFTALSRGEESALAELQERIRSSFFSAAGSNDVNAIYRRLDAFLRKAAADSGIRDLVLAPFAKPASAGVDARGEAGGSFVVHQLQLGFSGGANSVRAFFTSLAAYPLRLRLERLRIDAQASGPAWTVVLHAYQAGERPFTLSGQGLALDADSPILWRSLPRLPATPAVAAPEGSASCQLHAFRRSAIAEELGLPGRRGQGKR